MKCRYGGGHSVVKPDASDLTGQRFTINSQPATASDFTNFGSQALKALETSLTRVMGFRDPSQLPKIDPSQLLDDISKTSIGYSVVSANQGAANNVQHYVFEHLGQVVDLETSYNPSKARVEGYKLVLQEIDEVIKAFVVCGEWGSLETHLTCTELIHIIFIQSTSFADHLVVSQSWPFSRTPTYSASPAPSSFSPPPSPSWSHTASRATRATTTSVL